MLRLPGGAEPAPWKDRTTFDLPEFPAHNMHDSYLTTGINSSSIGLTTSQLRGCVAASRDGRCKTLSISEGPGTGIGRRIGGDFTTRHGDMEVMKYRNARCVRSRNDGPL